MSNSLIKHLRQLIRVKSGSENIKDQKFPNYYLHTSRMGNFL